MPKEQMRMLYKSRSNRILGGVCGGIGEYLNVDPTIIRIVWILATLLSLGIGVLVYIFAWILIPNNPSGK